MNVSKTKIKKQTVKIYDVKKTKYVTAMVLLFTSVTLFAQNTPPTPPMTPTASVTSSSSTSSTSSTSVSTDGIEDDSKSSSVSISQSNENYRFKARYHSSKNEGIKQLLLKELGEENFTNDGKTLTWIGNKNNKQSFDCKLTNGRLRMSLDMDNTSKSFSKKVKELGLDLKYYISGSNRSNEKAKSVEAAKRKLEEAQKELERAERN